MSTSAASQLKLTICISTLNRARFIGATLENVLSQLTDQCELLVLDAASTDDTEAVVAQHTRGLCRVRYIKQAKNNGMDRDYDRAVELAMGEYCWLMPDDDFLRPGAIATVLRELERDVSLVIVNVESRDFRMQKVVHPCWLRLRQDRRYGPDEMDRLFADADQVVRYIGCMIIKRSIWLAREKQRYYGTWWLYVGVIFQQQLPGEAVIIAKPLVSYRMSNTHTFGSVAGELNFAVWPSLVETLQLSKSAIRKVHSAEPWRHLEWLLFLRASAIYSRAEYRKWIRPRLRSRGERLIPALAAVFPGKLANVLLSSYCALHDRKGYLPWLKESPFYFRNWRAARRAA